MPAEPRADRACDITPFTAAFSPADEAMASTLMESAPRTAEAERRIDARARRLIGAIRARAGGLGGVEDFLPA
jgi:RHH-type proline utilization regulon transcriptional repressor/proline dehydrogenase/delta 1-pyrroline-5-carboxylate dehydrogenase